MLSDICGIWNEKKYAHAAISVDSIHLVRFNEHWKRWQLALHWHLRPPVPPVVQGFDHEVHNAPAYQISANRNRQCMSELCESTNFPVPVFWGEVRGTRARVCCTAWFLLGTSGRNCTKFGRSCSIVKVKRRTGQKSRPNFALFNRCKN